MGIGDTFTRSFQSGWGSVERVYAIIDDRKQREAAKVINQQVQGRIDAMQNDLAIDAERFDELRARQAGGDKTVNDEELRTLGVTMMVKSLRLTQNGLSIVNGALAQAGDNKYVTQTLGPIAQSFAALAQGYHDTGASMAEQGAAGERHAEAMAQDDKQAAEAAKRDDRAFDLDKQRLGVEQTRADAELKRFQHESDIESGKKLDIGAFQKQLDAFEAAAAEEYAPPIGEEDETPEARARRETQQGESFKKRVKQRFGPDYRDYLPKDTADAIWGSEDAQPAGGEPARGGEQQSAPENDPEVAALVEQLDSLGRGPGPTHDIDRERQALMDDLEKRGTSYDSVLSKRAKAKTEGRESTERAARRKRLGLTASY